jgi:uncharacterized protein (DUF39 family)
MNDVDVVTSATRALMSGTMAIFSFRVAEKKQFMRAAEVYLDDVPVTPGPAPNENIGWIDCIVTGTAKKITDDRYGGGHLFRDIVSGKDIEVKVKSIEGKVIKTTTNINDMPFATMYMTRGVCALMVYTNPGKKFYENYIFCK